MRIPLTLFAVVLSAASAVAAHAQVAASGAVNESAAAATIPSGMSFAFDASQKHVVASGVQLSASTIKSDSVSPTTGTIIVTININVVSRFEAGTTYHCSVDAIGGIIDLRKGVIDGGLETVNNFATGSGTSFSCTMTIPYSWTLPHAGRASTGLILAFGVGAINEHDEVEHSTLQVDGIENLPATGATSKFTFNVAL